MNISSSKTVYKELQDMYAPAKLSIVNYPDMSVISEPVDLHQDAILYNYLENNISKCSFLYSWIHFV